MVYHLYGVRLHSAWRLPYPAAAHPAVADITLSRERAPYFHDARVAAARLPQPWAPIVEGMFPDGATYLQWPRRFEFLVSADGGHIAGRPLTHGTPEGFHTHLLGQALSFALIRQGLDPLHATVVTAGGGVGSEAGIAFLGHSGYGKSSLAAAFIAAGHTLLTDDLLVLTERAGSLVAHPGPPRLKLYPQSARRLLPRARSVRMMRSTPKRLLPLPARLLAPGPVPLRAIYALVPAQRRRADSDRITIRRLAERDACLALIRNTFNASVLDPDRLARQLSLAAHVAATVPVKSLSYPRSFAALPAVREAILADIQRDGPVP